MLAVSMMVNLIEDLKTYDWMVRPKASHDSGLEILFLSIPESIQLGLCFSTVFGLDCNYKTNCFNLSLIHIVCTAFNNQSFYLDFGLMDNQKEETYI